MVQHYIRGLFQGKAMKLSLNSNLNLKFKEGGTSEGLYENGISIAIVLDHRSTALFIGKRPDWRG